MTPTARLNPRFFVLQTGDEIMVGDEYYNPTVDRWLPVQSETIGDEWNDDESKPVRRMNKEYAMAYYDVTLKGYCGSTDATDHLVKWIKAESKAVVTAWLEAIGVMDIVQAITPMAMVGDLGKTDGIDVELSRSSYVLAHHDFKQWRNESNKITGGDR